MTCVVGTAIRIATANPRAKVGRPPFAFSRYDRTAKNTSSADSTIRVVPEDFALVEPEPIRERHREQHHARRNAPEINPKVSTVSFICDSVSLKFHSHAPDSGAIRQPCCHTFG